MGKIIGDTLRDKQAKGLSFLLKYSDFEACFTDAATEDIYLHVRFTHSQSYRKEQRDKLKDDGLFHLCGCHYSPHGGALWVPKDVKNPLVINAASISIPYQVVEETKLKRSHVREILCEKINKFTQKDFTSAGWHVSLKLLAKLDAIECTYGYYGAAWQGTPTVENIPLETAQKPETDNK